MDLLKSTYRRPFTVDGIPVMVVHVSRLQRGETTLFLAGQPVASDTVLATEADALRNHRVATTLADGRRLEVEMGPASWRTFGIAARLDGVLIHESHPGRALGHGKTMKDVVARIDAMDTPEKKAEAEREMARAKETWRRNWPSMATDIALGLAFFFIAREIGLVTAAIVGAIAGVVLFGVQKLSRIDLLGGLAVFGIVMGLISAGFALGFQDEDIVKYRGTFMGVLGGTLFLLDGLNGGRLLAARMARYFAFDIDVARLGIGAGAISLIMAGLNPAVAEMVSTETWLFYTTFLDTVVAIGLFLLMLRWAKGPSRSTSA